MKTDELRQRITDLRAKGERWHKDHIIPARRKLRPLMAEVYTTGKECSTDKAAITAVDKMLEAEGITLKGSPSIFRKLANLIFCDDSPQRISVYSRGLENARTEMVPAHKFDEWLAGFTCIDDAAEIKQTIKVKVAASDKRAAGQTKLEAAFPVATLPEVFGVPAEVGYVLMVGEVKSNFETDVYGFVTDTTLVGRVMELVGSGTITVADKETDSLSGDNLRSAIDGVVSSMSDKPSILPVSLAKRAKAIKKTSINVPIAVQASSQTTDKVANAAKKGGRSQ